MDYVCTDFNVASSSRFPFRARTHTYTKLQMPLYSPYSRVVGLPALLYTSADLPRCYLWVFVPEFFLNVQSVFRLRKKTRFYFRFERTEQLHIMIDALLESAVVVGTVTVCLFVSSVVIKEVVIAAFHVAVSAAWSARGWSRDAALRRHWSR